VSQIQVGTISPVPSEEEAVAIAAAATLLWPHPVSAPSSATGVNTAWRFSGRWWATDAVSRRSRPGV
jgi:hypothetical protein